MNPFDDLSEEEKKEFLRALGIEEDDKSRIVLCEPLEIYELKSGERFVNWLN